MTEAVLKKEAAVDVNTTPMTRMALSVAYDGRPWRGWQTQPGGQTVQDQLEAALAKFAGQPLATICAGRTDAGVHALTQVVHLDAPFVRPETAWVRGLNRYLPDSIAIQWAQPVASTFHARFDATSRTYIYRILNTRVPHPLWTGRAGWCLRPLCVQAMQEAAARLIGEHDFSSYRSSQCQAATPVRQMHEASVWREGRFILLRFRANAFLHHMVRNLVGELVYVGLGRRSLDDFERILEARDRRLAAPTYAAAGLYLVGVSYPSETLRREGLLRHLIEDVHGQQIIDESLLHVDRAANPPNHQEN